MIQHPGDLNADTWHHAADLGVYAWYYTPRFCDVIPGPRKFRLFMVACYRAVWDFIPFAEFRTAVEAGERFADDGDLGPATTACEAVVAAMGRELSCWRPLGWALTSVPMDDPFEGGLLPSWSRTRELEAPDLNPSAFNRTPEASVALHLALFRDIFGNPFRPIGFDPMWRSDTALSLAKQMYESRDFSAMPILADALQDAGCDNDDIFDHCRDASGVHVRGCWVVDMLLGKS